MSSTTHPNLKLLITVWQPQTEDNEGNARPNREFYASYGEAKKACSGYGKGPEPLERKALPIGDNKALIVESFPVKIMETVLDAKKLAALAKLTAEERELLGL